MAGARRAILATCALALVAMAPTAHAQGPIPLPPLPPGGGQQPPPKQPPPPPTAPPNPAGYDVALHVDAARDGHSADDDLAPPLLRRWRTSVGFPLSYPLIAQGLVFVVVENPRASAGTLVALDLSTGAVKWQSPAPYGYPAYDGGRVFVVGDQVVRAYTADNGQQLWDHVGPSSQQAAEPPLASRGILYAGYSADLIALNESDGSVRWSVATDGNFPSSDGDSVFVASGCGNAAAYSAGGGERRWFHSAGCSGGGADTPILHGQRIYLNEAGRTLDARTGTATGTFGNSRTLVFAGDTAIAPAQDGALYARRLDGSTLWRTRAPLLGGDTSKLALPPIAVGSTVYNVAGGRLYAYSADTGELLFVDLLPPVAFDHAEAASLNNLAGGQGTLVVPVADQLVAYSSALAPAPGGIATLPFEPDLPLNGLLILDGRLGHDLRAGGKRPVRAQVDRFPFGKWSQAADGTTRSDGTFTFSGHVDRNTRLRVVLPGTGVASPPSEFFVYPKVAFHARAVGRRVIAVRMGFTVARDTHLGGRRAFVYLDRVKRHRLERLGSGRVRGRRGRFSATTTVRLPGHLGAKDRFAYCIPHLSRAGLGRADAIDRHCGRRTLRG